MITFAQFLRLFGPSTASLAPRPVITSDSSVHVDEGVPLVFALTANETCTFAIVGGVDAADFSIVGTTLNLPAQTYADGGDNLREVQIRATSVATGRQSLVQAFQALIDEIADVTPILLASHTMKRGRLTRQGSAAVLLQDLMLSSGDPPTTWTVTLTSGTAAHWTTPTDGTSPTPTATGDAANLNGGPYVFNVSGSSPAGDSNVAVLTIDTTFAGAGDVYTISKKSEIAGTNGSLTVVPVTTPTEALVSPILDGKRIQFARGATDLGLGVYGAGLSFLKLRVANRAYIEHEDPAHPCPVTFCQVRLCKNLSFGFKTTSARRNNLGSPGDTEAAWYIRASGPNAANPDCQGCRWENTNGMEPGQIGVRDTPDDQTRFVIAMKFDSSSAPLTGMETTNFYAEDVFDGFNYQRGNFNIEVHHKGTTTVERWCNDAIVTSGSDEAGPIIYDRLILARPIFSPAQYGVHTDGFQQANLEHVKNLWIKTYINVQADGDSYTQNLFANGSLLGIRVDNMLYVGRSVHAMKVPASDAAHPFIATNTTAVMQMSGPYGTSGNIGGTTWNHTPGANNYPRMELRAEATDVDVTSAFFQGTMSNSSSFTPGADVIHLNGATDLTAYFEDPSWISSQAMRDVMNANLTTQNFMGLVDVRWNGTIAEILEDLSASLRPKAGGPLDNGDGSSIGFYNLDGSEKS